MKFKILLLLLTLIVSNPLFSQDVKFIASLQRNPVVQGERFQLTFSLHNAQGTRFTPPSFRGFNALMGPSTQQSTQVINGKMSQQVSYTYVLQAKKTGSFTFGPATITVNGNPIKSNSLTINVVEPSEAEKQRRANKKKEEQSLSQQAQKIIKQNLFVTLAVNKTNVHLGEQIVATYKLFLHPELNLTSLEPQKEPSFNGFWTQQLNTGETRWQTEIVNGVRFRSAVIKKVVLLPQQSGKLTLEPYKFDCVARLRVQGQSRRRSRDMWDEFFGGRGNYKDFNYIASSGVKVINVKPLPTPKPEEFDGTVGNIKMEAWIDKPQTNAGEPISLKVKVSGSGNLKLLDPLDIEFPPDFEVYDPKTADNLVVNAGGISGSKVFEYLIIPKHEGEYKIAPVTLSYFDLKKKDYVRLTSEEFIINVGEGDGTETAIVSGVQKEDIQYLGKDIRFIKKDINLEKDNQKLFASTGFYFGALSPLLLLILVLVYKKKRDELTGNQALWKNRQATKIAKKRLTSAKKLMEQNSEEKFFEEISKALWGYISDKLSIPVSELSKESATSALLKNNIIQSEVTRYLDVIDKSEYARFAPKSEGNTMNSIYSDAVDVISKFEGVLK